MPGACRTRARVPGLFDATIHVDPAGGIGFAVAGLRVTPAELRLMDDASGTAPHAHAPGPHGGDPGHSH